MSEDTDIKLPPLTDHDDENLMMSDFYGIQLIILHFQKQKYLIIYPHF